MRRRRRTNNHAMVMIDVLLCILVKSAIARYVLPVGRTPRWAVQSSDGEDSTPSTGDWCRRSERSTITPSFFQYYTRHTALSTHALSSQSSDCLERIARNWLSDGLEHGKSYLSGVLRWAFMVFICWKWNDISVASTRSMTTLRNSLKHIPIKHSLSVTLLRWLGG